ncbi:MULTISPECIES: hypothetical protein [Gilliamella]|uniref:Lipoprotein n=1 Tax=Gilliamella apicola TaxID=1196095 RepID=A0A556SAP7_9GAMM|nr:MULTISPECIES: hypothetical protein [Gilliamella]MBI0095655.1 hypothetical protein [Gilliamella sp. W8136]TSJ98203.1 hypothetical protein FPQ15_09825 [Gilliamella apicola]
MKKLRYHLMLISGLFLATVLTGCFCTQKVEVLPKSLPNATLGAPYYAEIKILGGIVMDDFFSYHIKPARSGLELSSSYFTPNSSYNYLKVEGIPKVTGTITIKFSGLTYGTMCPGVELDKTYTIKVEE